MSQQEKCIYLTILFTSIYKYTYENLMYTNIQSIHDKVHNYSSGIASNTYPKKHLTVSFVSRCGERMVQIFSAVTICSHISLELGEIKRRVEVFVSLKLISLLRFPMSRSFFFQPSIFVCTFTDILSASSILIK